MPKVGTISVVYKKSAILLTAIIGFGIAEASSFSRLYKSSKPTKPSYDIKFEPISTDKNSNGQNFRSTRVAPPPKETRRQPTQVNEPPAVYTADPLYNSGSDSDFNQSSDFFFYGDSPSSQGGSGSSGGGGDTGSDSQNSNIWGY